MGCLKISYQSRITVIDEKQIFVDFGYEKNARTKNICSNYYPGGMLMPNRNGGAEYRYGFGNHENDNEVKGKGNHLSFGNFGYDSRLMRRMNIDPLIGEFPSMSSYAVFNNNPIYFADPTGMSPDGPGDEKGACSDGGCQPVQTPNYGSSKLPEMNLVNVPTNTKGSWLPYGETNKLGSFVVDGTSYSWDKDKNWYLDFEGNSYNEGSYSEGLSNGYKPTIKGAENSWNQLYTLNPIKDAKDWWKKSGQHGDYWTGYWSMTDYQKGQNDGGALTGMVQGLPIMAMTYGISKGFGSYRTGLGLTSVNIDIGVTSMLTNSEGYLFGSFIAKTPFSMKVQRFGGTQSVIGPDYWGLRLGSSSFVGRKLNAIWPSWNNLRTYTTGVVGAGTTMKFGITGPQSFRYGLFGGAPQFQIMSKQIMKQTSKGGN